MAPVQEIKEMLKQMQLRGVLTYIPASELPKITYLCPRKDAKELIAFTKILADKKARKEQKIEKIGIDEFHRHNAHVAKEWRDKNPEYVKIINEKKLSVWWQYHQFSLFLCFNRHSAFPVLIFSIISSKSL